MTCSKSAKGEYSITRVAGRGREGSGTGALFPPIAAARTEGVAGAEEDDSSAGCARSASLRRSEATERAK